MMKVIDADELIDVLYQHGFLPHMDKLRELIDEQPDLNGVSYPWCHGCEEYDQVLHCCHRFSTVIRDTVAEIKATGRLDGMDLIELEDRFGSEVREVVEDMMSGKGGKSE